MMGEAIKAYKGEGLSVIYVYDDGRKERWSEGSRAWRNRNPGNVISNNEAWNGKIGNDGKFCIFDNFEAGKRVTRIILNNRRREGRTLAEAITSYAPPHENNVEDYISAVEKYSGIKRNTRLNTLNAAQMEKIADGIFEHEGNVAGKVEVLETSGAKVKGKYVWHTMEDEKVRPDHAERDGKVFDFANPPPGGNPGDAYGCRCWAEPIPDKDLKGVFGK